ncbi:MAG: desulfoferrodoxin family protein [Patescibacteria group bacterium]
MSELIYTAENPGEFAEKKEKHIPVIEIDGSTVKVRVGIEEHPMEPAHYIEWIALYQDGEELARQDLTPDDAPEATFDNIENIDKLKVREHCNIHGTWESN